MNALLMNVILALTWAAVTGAFTAGNLLLGFVLSFAVILVTRQIIGVPRYGRRTRQVFALASFFIWELIKANVRVAYDVITPGYQIRPGVVGIPLDVKTDAEITLLANLITLTPGTLSLDVSADRKVLYIHAMYLTDAETLRRQIKQGFERRIIEVMR
jgi:multicomponent Na+:H+ antiporter subunit E